MKFNTIYVLCLFATLQTLNAQSNLDHNKTYAAKISTMSDAEYPDNNAIGFRSSKVGIFNHNEIIFAPTHQGNFDITIMPGNKESDTILLREINLDEFMPSIPNYVKSDNYLQYIALLNQEWNRIQVKFNAQQFTANGAGEEDKVISRIDIANNCLGKGDWEIICFTKEDNKEVLYFQCWFTFPEELYNHLFKKRNGIEITQFDDMLKNYGNKPSEVVNLSVLRAIQKEREVAFTNLNNQLYPIKGERQTKAKNVIFPTNYTSINELLTNKTTYATFARPGMYTKTQPRKTELNLLSNLSKVIFASTTSTNTAKTATSEIQLIFSENEHTTKYIIGGIILDKIPVLNMENLHNGFQRSMGIGNHSFYNAYADIIANSSLENPYYGLLTDGNGLWLDSHQIGTDGPLLFKEEGNEQLLHILLLSFERHTFVGHYIIEIPN